MEFKVYDLNLKNGSEEKGKPMIEKRAVYL